MLGTTSSDTIGSVVHVGCNVFVAWTSYASVPGTIDEETVSWGTEVVAFDGTPLAPPALYPSLDVTSTSSAAITATVNGDHAGAVVTYAENSRFVPLDTTGALVGDAVTLTTSWVADLEPLAGGGFSYVVADGVEGATPTTLVTLDATGAMVATQPLGDPSDRVLWGRTLLEDGSFLLDTFGGPSTSTTDVWLQHFDAAGNALSGAVLTAADIAPALVALTPRGAVASWSYGATATVVATDESGTETAAAETIPVPNALYGQSISPTPSGDVLITLLELTEDASFNEIWTVHVQERTEEGAPRGPLAALPSTKNGASPNHLAPIVAPDGVHALFVSDGDGIVALPLVCAD
jgi:hypothetical protein